MTTEIKLGDKVKDKVTGFKGIAIGVTTWLHGCKRIAVQPQELKDGKPIDALSFDEPQLEMIESEKIKTGSRETGGPRPEPAQRAAAKR